ncbi:MAG TPA: Uma2 family endonuclease [Urbifossiella sp.]|jgi:Uma2 family endonuclease|nr:Uma2 family endonuclease [Urbifossiella sp.]
MSALTLPMPPALAPPSDPVPTLPPVAPLRWTRDEYYRLADAGFFAGKRVMLIDGEILAVSPQNEPHSTAIVVTAAALHAAFGDGMTYRQQMPLDLGQASDPEPDIAVIAGPPRSQPRRHPTMAALVVEVADSSLAYDTGDKAGFYAAGVIADYWVVDLVHNRLVVFRDPRPDPTARFGHSYAAVLYRGPGDSLTPLAAPNSFITIADLLP